MDQDAYRRTYHELNQRYCRFEKGIISGNCQCSQAQSFNLAEREGIHCCSDVGQSRCTELISLIRHHSRFTLKENSEYTALPHSKALKIEIGGLRGVRMVLNDDETTPLFIDDIFELIDLAIKRFGDLNQLPYQEIIKQVAAYKGRKKE